MTSVTHNPSIRGPPVTPAREPVSSPAVPQTFAVADRGSHTGGGPDPAPEAPAMFVIPGAVLAIGLMKFQKWMKSKTASGSLPPLDYRCYAVPPRGVDGFVDEHPDAVPYGRFATLLGEYGYPPAAVSECLTRGGAMARQYPDHLVVVADIRRG